ncbi:MAG TPA: membrane protein insertase YidC [Thermoleophilia bacterium]|nr:membrane protein insertase YidC [Thermoleophilia bacterium]
MIRSHQRKPRSLLLVVLLVATLLMVTLFAASCSFLGDTATTTAAAVTTTVEGATTSTVAGATTTTIEEGAGGGFLAGPLKPLSALFFWVLEFLHDNLGISWSWSIVLLTVIVRVILVPLTWRQIKSMRAMQALQPQIKALQEKYRDNREVLNQKTMEFYRENKVSPFGSCLPLVLQLPVFFGLYYMLSTAGKAGLDPDVAGRWAGVFVNPTVSWLWIRDITQFDYLLMFLYIASQFVASWQTARKAGSQQKMIAYFMPVMVGIFMFIGKWPSGLFIYWVTSNVWTIAQQYVAEKVMPVPVSVVAAPAKGGTAKGTSGRTGPSKAPAGKSAAVKTGPANVTPSKATTAKPAGQTGGKSSGQKTGKQGKAGRQGQRSNRGAGRPKGSR